MKHMKYIANSGIKVLVYNGDKDFLCNWKGGEKWTKKLKWNKHYEFKKQEFKNWIIGEKRRGLYKI